MTYESSRIQSALPGLCPIEAALATMAGAGRAARGAIFTRREVVEFILNLVGYVPSLPLHRQRLLEPSVGAGDFLLPAVERLMDAYDLVPAHERGDVAVDLAGCICAVELHDASYHTASQRVAELLQSRGLNQSQARALSRTWLRRGDFLLEELDGSFDYVVGNPPYVRQEDVSAVLMAEYRRRFTTIFDRADLYIPFIERSLLLLSLAGRLGFICADRWTKNRYGGPLRKMVTQEFRLRCFIDMVDTPAFHSDVIAYPAIVIIGREPPGPTRVAFRPQVRHDVLHRLARALDGESVIAGNADVSELPSVGNGMEPWMLGEAAPLGLARRLEATFPALEETGCKVGIGVATGADRAFIGCYDDLDVEPDRKLPLVTTRDVANGTVLWQGLGVVNPFAPDGSLVPLASYPRLKAHFDRHGAAIKARHVSKKSPRAWYRTIDRIDPSLTTRPKLLIPDIKGTAHVVFEAGLFYPHHNLYYVVSTTWNLRALQAVLLSDVTRLFVSLYSTRMRGGYLRFQAQYLRRIRLPPWEQVPGKLREALATAAVRGNLQACNSATAELYGLSGAERSLLERMDWLLDGA